MGSQRSYNVAVNELLPFISMDKQINDDINFVFQTRSKTKSPFGYYEWQSTHIVHAGDTVDGLFLHLKTIRYETHDYHSFRLFYRYKGHVNNIHQLEIYPLWKNSHAEPDGTKLYGTHIHELTNTYEVRPQGYEKFDWYDWLAYYITKTNITLTGKQYAPNNGELF